MCGEKSRPRASVTAAFGSPPRVRGEGRPGVLIREPRGITPACAGRSCFSAAAKSTTTDHPRVCGEKLTEVDCLYLDDGSPPRVRGEVCPRKICVHRSRITPACAGRRLLVSAHASSALDHPRVCGEKFEIVEEKHYIVGSPPRVRGEVTSKSDVVSNCRITPACAGRRLCIIAASRSTRDHPRVCGEKDYAETFERFRIGSPPRVRGEDGKPCRSRAPALITPACAGRSPRSGRWA